MDNRTFPSVHMGGIIHMDVHTFPSAKVVSEQAVGMCRFPPTYPHAAHIVIHQLPPGRLLVLYGVYGWFMAALSQLLTASVTMPSTTADTADSATMTFAVGSSLPIPSSIHNDWFDALNTYIDDLRIAGALYGYGGDVLVKIYNPLLSAPNYPIYEDTFVLPSDSAVDLPREVALCVSYYNSLDNTVARARRRGRHFVPGHREAGNDSGRPSSTLIGLVSTAFGDYLNDPFNGTTPADPITPCVYSRAEGAGFLINRAYVDNEWDTQRRRGTKATSRTYPTGWEP